MSDSFWPIYVGILAASWALSDRMPQTTATEYTEAKRCVLKVTSDVGHDVKTGRPIKRDSDGNWQWYTPGSSDLTCFKVNVSTTNYRAYGEVGKVAVWVDAGDSAGMPYEYLDCVIGDAKNWACKSPERAMVEGVYDKEHHIDWLKWQFNRVVTLYYQYDHRWYTQE
jgi:hypothetical protein